MGGLFCPHMTIRGNFLVVLTIGLVVLAGCSGLSDELELGGQQVSCPPGSGQASALAPEPPDRWTLENKTKGYSLEYVYGYEGSLLANYTAPSGTPVVLVITEWESHDLAVKAKNGSLMFGTRAVVGNYLIDTWANSTKVSTELILETSCVSKDDISEIGFNFTNFSFTASSDADFSVSNVEHEISASPAGTTIDLQIEGIFENTSVIVEGGQFPKILDEKEVEDGTANVQVTIPDSAITEPRTVQLTISPSDPFAGKNHTETITLEGAEIELQNLQVKTEPATLESGARVSQVTFTLKNSGGTPAYVDSVTVEGEDSGDIIVDEVLSPGSSVHVNSDDNALLLPHLSSEGGTLTFDVYAGNKVVASDQRTFEGADLTIEDVSLDVHESSFSQGGRLEGVKLTVTNRGDLPTTVSGMHVFVNGKDHQTFTQKQIGTSQTATVEGTIFTELSSGSNTIEIKVYSGKTVVATYKTQVRI